jgi:phosphoribosylamine--glycine ligase
MADEKIAVIDGGGRGSALIEKYLDSPHVESAIAIPGNDLMSIGKEKPVKVFPKLKTTDIRDIVEICRKEGVTFVDIAQENAIEAGLVDALESVGIPVLGPTKKAGEIESDKIFGRLFGRKHNLPQPEFAFFDLEDAGELFIEKGVERPVFIKANGLCEGKGAIPAKNREEALDGIRRMKEFKNGAGRRYLVEDWLINEDGSSGEEFSAFGISDGQTVRILGYAQDHKRVDNFDVGKNTGGTGCSAPPLVLTDKIKRSIESFFDTAVAGLAAEGRTYRGVLYLGGILIRRKGSLEPYIIEWNGRWGDPECQVILPGIKNDLFEIGIAAVNNNVKNLKIETDGKARVAVAGMSRGYPDNYDAVKGKRIFGLEDAMGMEGVKVYGAGVDVVDGCYYARGGRLFYIVGEGRDVIEARKRAYAAISTVSIEGNNLHYRTDIGWRDVMRLAELSRF